MKDYTLEKKDDFILNYEKKYNYIYIRYASGKEFKKEYSRELEIYLLNQMKVQIETYGKFLVKQVNKEKIKIKIKLILAFLIFIGVNFLMPKLVLIESLKWLLIFMTTFTCSFVSIKQIQNNKRYKEIINDYMKNINFLENIELFRNNLTDDMGVYHKEVNENVEQVIINLSIKIKTTKNLEPELREPTLNTIDKVSDSAFSVIYDSLKKDNEIKKGMAKTRKLVPNHNKF